MAAAVAVYNTESIVGSAEVRSEKSGSRLVAVFTRLPPGKHGFHIHRAGDLRGEGCAGACDHFHVGSPVSHGGAPSKGKTRKNRHSGDLGNIQLKGKKVRYSYFLPDIKPHDLWGRSLIIHADEDDLGKGGHEDSHTTGHSGARIGCAIFGRASDCTRRQQRNKQ